MSSSSYKESYLRVESTSRTGCKLLLLSRAILNHLLSIQPGHKKIMETSEKKVLAFKDKYKITRRCHQERIYRLKETQSFCTPKQR